MEQTRRPTISLVLPMVHKMIALMDPNKMLTVVDYSSGMEYNVEVSSTEQMAVHALVNIIAVSYLNCN